MIKKILTTLNKCEQWFNKEFGWFFTNGNKRAK